MLPYEIISEIVSYIPNIETRMNFKIYHKIRDKYKDLLETTIRKPPEFIFPYQHHLMKKNVDFLKHNHGGYKNDFIDIEFREKDNIIKISLHIWKLMRRPYEEFTHDNDVYMLGEFRKTHYWKSVTSTYII